MFPSLKFVLNRKEEEAYLGIEIIELSSYPVAW